MASESQKACSIRRRSGRSWMRWDPCRALDSEDCLIARRSPLRLRIACRSARLLGGDALPVRAIYFDKSPESNWGVAWHQDLTIAVAARAVVPGFDRGARRVASPASSRRTRSSPEC
ncbi:MAG: hypothetical protein R3F11_04210 [Verrucomicrobiales bacterium]